MVLYQLVFTFGRELAPVRLTPLEHREVLLLVLSFAEFGVGAREFTIDQGERRPLIHGDLEHLRRFAEPTFIPQNIPKILGDAALSLRK